MRKRPNKKIRRSANGLTIKIKAPVYSKEKRVFERDPDIIALQESVSEIKEALSTFKCEEPKGEKPKPGDGESKPPANPKPKPAPKPGSWLQELKQLITANGSYEEAVSVSRKTNVTQAKEFAAHQKVPSIPKSGETYINWLAINSLIGIEEHVKRLLETWTENFKSKSLTEAKLATSIASDCSGKMAYEFAEHLKIRNSKRSEKDISKEIAKFIIKQTTK